MPRGNHRKSAQASRRTAARALPLWITALVVLALAPALLATRTQLKPGWNMFSPDQDIEIGKKLSQQVPQEMALLDDARITGYLNDLGRRLAAHAPGYHYPYQYRAVNSSAINAFALPGGFIYINRGTIEAADDEAELAGVLAHETAHVALRHGTNQASKAYAAEIPAALLSGWLGTNSLVSAALTRFTAGIVVKSVFLRYSREDETQADVLGTQILYDAGYDPRALARFFEKIQAQSKSQPIEFFSDHPNPEHRVDRVMLEVDRLGGLPAGYKEDSREFHRIQKYLRSLPPPPKPQEKPQPQ